MLKRYRAPLALASLAALLTGPVSAQTSDITITNPPELRYVGPILRPFHFERRIVSAPRLSNTPRLESLVHAGNLYLTVQDVIALVLENNLDIEIQRYGPFLAKEVQRRADAGNLLRSVSSPVLAGPTSVSTAGVSLNASGLSGGGLFSGAGVVTSIGPNPPNLDPSIYASFSAGHQSSPISNTTLQATSELVTDYRQYVFQYSQSFLSGTSAYLTYNSYHALNNSPSQFLNPTLNGALDLTIQQSLLQGFGFAVNKRYIRVARNNQKVSDLTLKQQVIATISAALNLYWDLVTFDDTVRISDQAVATAQKLYDDNQAEVKLGALAPIEVTRAAAALSAAKENLLIAQTNVAQQEIVLKNALTRNSADAAWLDEVHIVPLDHIEIPPVENLKPTAELIQQAMTNRPEIEQARINLASQELQLKGDRNGLLPNLSAFVDLTNNGLAGAINPLYNGASGAPNAYFVGAYGDLLSQIFRRNFPSYAAGFSLNIPLRNRAAQADFVTDALGIRQTELQLKRALNQISVEVKTNVIGLEQARARYETAVNTRKLSQQNLEAEQNRFKFGAVTDATLVIAAQNQLASDQTAEAQSVANYTHARIAFDQALGQTLDVNNIMMNEAASGHVARPSALPASVLSGASK